MTNKSLKIIKKYFNVSVNEMRKLAGDFRSEMDKGLAGRKSSLKMIPTYTKRPSGTEIGKYIALDLGGTNFRVLEIELEGSGRMSRPRVMKFKLNKRHITGSGDLFFGFIAGCLKNFLVKNKEMNSVRKMGFTFSFPVKQTEIASGNLVCWTKGFKVSGVIGEDIVGLLEAALNKKGIRGVRVAALINDTVGTLAAKSYEDKNCNIGVIIGTGTNACYAEPELGGMIVNTEWGNFDKMRRTVFDILVDSQSDRPGQQVLEKMVSGMYLGEVALKVIRAHVLPGLKHFNTEQMSAIESDRSNGLTVTGKVLKMAGIKDTTPEERLACREISSIISLRAARLSAACLEAIVKKIDPSISNRHTIAIDGSVYEKHPSFANNISSALKDMLGTRAARIKVVLAKDGSGVGAAITAAAAG
ncbi:MAG: hexokinase [Candidatus Omnitrophica bacterium]|nr:hexokinase [Candidatus Omnitrophota bacterium]